MAQLAMSFPRKTVSTCPRDILGMVQNCADAPRKRFATLTDARCVLAGCSRGLMIRNVGSQKGVARPTESVFHARAPAPQIAGLYGCHSVVSRVMSGRPHRSAESLQAAIAAGTCGAAQWCLHTGHRAPRQRPRPVGPQPLVQSGIAVRACDRPPRGGSRSSACRVRRRCADPGRSRRRAAP